MRVSVQDKPWSAGLVQSLPPAGKTALAMLCFVLIYGSFFPLLKVLLQDISPLHSAMLRLVGTGILAALIEGIWIKSRIQSRQDWVLLILCGIFTIFMVQVLAAVAIPMTTSFHATLLMSTIPLQTAVYAWLLGREGLWPQKMAGILIGGLGVAALILAQQGGGTLPPTYWIGDALVLLNSMAFSGYILVSQRLVQRYSPFTVITYASMIAALMALVLVSIGPWLPPGFIPHEAGPVPNWSDLWASLQALSVAGGWILAYTIVLAGIAGYWFNNIALKYSPSSTVASYILLQPVWAAFLGVSLVGESFTLPMAAATLLTLLGVWLATQKPRGAFHPLFISQLHPVRWLHYRWILTGRSVRDCWSGRRPCRFRL